MNILKNIDKVRIGNKKIRRIVGRGVKYSLLLCLLACFVLQVYLDKLSPDAFYIGTSLLESGVFFINMFIICGFVFDKITI